MELNQLRAERTLNILTYSGLIFTTHYKLYLHSWDLELIIIPDYTHLKLNLLGSPGGNLIKILEDLVRSWKIL